MSKQLEPWGIAMLLLLLSLGGAGCIPATNGPETEDAEPPIPVRGEMQILCEDGPPFQIVEPDGPLTGMTVEVVRELQERVGNQDEIQVVPWARGYEEVLNTPNTMLFSMARTQERDALFYWVGPVAETTFGFYARADADLTITSLEDAKQVQAIGVYQNDVRDVFLTEAGFTNLDRSHAPVQNFRKLMEGRVELLAESDNAIADNAAANGYAPEDVKLLYVFMRSQLYIAISRQTDPAVARLWQEAFTGMQADGSLAAIYARYFPARPLPGPPVVAH